MNEKQAHKLMRDIIHLRNMQDATFIEDGRAMKKLRDEKGYEHLGYDSFSQCIDELQIPPSTALHRISVIEKFSDELGMSDEKMVEIGFSKLLIIKSVVDNDVEDWVIKAKTLTQRDLRQEVNEYSGKYKDQRTCEHENSYTITICRDCNLRTKNE